MRHANETSQKSWDSTSSRAHSSRSTGAPSESDGDKILFIFDGGMLSAEQVKGIRLQRSEFSDYRYVAADELSEYTVERLAQRIRAVLPSQQRGQMAYLEDGDPVPH